MVRPRMVGSMNNKKIVTILGCKSCPHRTIANKCKLTLQEIANDILRTEIMAFCPLFENTYEDMYKIYKLHYNVKLYKLQEG